MAAGGVGVAPLQGEYIASNPATVVRPTPEPRPATTAVDRIMAAANLAYGVDMNPPPPTEGRSEKQRERDTAAHDNMLHKLAAEKQQADSFLQQFHTLAPRNMSRAVASLSSAHRQMGDLP